VIEPRPPSLLRLKLLLRDVHRAVWRRVRLADSLSIGDLHRVIQLLMGWDEDHLHRFRIHGRITASPMSAGRVSPSQNGGKGVSWQSPRRRTGLNKLPEVAGLPPFCDGLPERARQLAASLEPLKERRTQEDE